MPSHKNTPLVSIVTITFNLVENKRKNSFIRCLESIQQQDYRNIQHIIIDGGSRDGTLSLISHYAKKGWFTYISEPDRGIYDAMNKGIKMAKGKYVAFLNSDDFYHDHRGVSAVVKELEKSNADFSYSPVVAVRDNKVVTNYPAVRPQLANIFYIMPFCHQTMFTKKSVLKQNLFDTAFSSAGDYDLVLRLYLKGSKIVYVNKCFVTYGLQGLSDKNQNSSIYEAGKVFYKNYSKLVDISYDDCKFIYDNKPFGIPPFLAKKLRKFKEFDYKEYTREYSKACASINWENQQLKKELSDIYDSPSWRIAYKIRSFAKKISPRGGVLRKTIATMFNKPKINLQ